jgi:PTS system cellobiose-specific IIC component
MLSAIVIGLTAPMLYCKLSKSEKLQIKMPDGVPPAVAKSFSALFPIIITMLVFGMIQPI